MLMWMLLGCTCRSDPEVLRDYTTARDAALAEVPPPPEGWAPDAVLHLSPVLLRELVTHALDSHGPWQRDVPVGRGLVLTPELRVQRLSLTASDTCPSCSSAGLVLRGSLQYRTRMLGTGEVPLAVAARAVVELDVAPVDGGWEVTARARSVDRIAIEVAGIPRGIVVLAEEPLRDWLERELLAMPPRVVGRLSEAFPLAAVRLTPVGEGLRVDLRTTAVDPGAVEVSGPPPTTGWALHVASASIASLARTRLFRTGPRSRFQLVGVPTALQVDDNQLTVDLRVWRTAPPGWWRDLRARASLVVDGDQLRLVPQAVDPIAASPGAFWADPLSGMGERYLCDQIKIAMDRSLPATRTTTVRGTSFEARITGLASTQDTAVQLVGSLRVIDR